jgi:sec-independent protein translocase protein TatA
MVIALIIFGPRKLPEHGKSLGKCINEFKKASTELQNTLEKEIQIEEQKDRDEKREREEAARAAAAPTPEVVDAEGTLGQTVSRGEAGS